MAVCFGHLQGFAAGICSFLPTFRVVVGVPELTRPVELDLGFDNGCDQRSESAEIGIVVLGRQMFNGRIHIVQDLLKRFFRSGSLYTFKRLHITRIQYICDDWNAAPLLEQQKIIITAQAVCLAKETLLSVCGGTGAKFIRNKVEILDKHIAAADAAVIVTPVTFHGHTVGVPVAKVDVKGTGRIAGALLEAYFVGCSTKFVSASKVFRIVLEVREVDIGVVKILLCRFYLGEHLFLCQVVTGRTVQKVFLARDSQQAHQDGGCNEGIT